MDQALARRAPEPTLSSPSSPAVATSPEAESSWAPPTNRSTANDATLFSHFADTPNTGGSGAVGWYDSMQRGRYLDKIHANSDEALAAVEAARKAGDPRAAEAVARAVFDERNHLRATTQGRLSPGGQAMSEALDQKWTWEQMLAKYGDEADEFTTAKRIAQGAGRSNPWMSRLAKGGKVLGPVSTGLGVAQAGYNISQAKEGERAKVTGGELGSLGGGALGGALGTLGGVALLGSGPPGWAALALGLLGSVAGGVLGSEGGKSVGEDIGESLSFAPEALGFPVRSSPGSDPVWPAW
jgi:hypothetical protein